MTPTNVYWLRGIEDDLCDIAHLYGELAKGRIDCAQLVPLEERLNHLILETCKAAAELRSELSALKQQHRQPRLGPLQKAAFALRDTINGLMADDGNDSSDRELREGYSLACDLANAIQDEITRRGAAGNGREIEKQ